MVVRIKLENVQFDKRGWMEREKNANWKVRVVSSPRE